MTKNSASQPPSNESTEEFAELRELGLAPGTYGSTQEKAVEVLIEAIWKNDIEKVRRLIALGVDVNACYCSHAIWCSGDAFVTPLMAAAQKTGSSEVAKVLLEHGADPTIARELREDIGYSDFKWQGLGRYETAVDLAKDNPEVLALLKQAMPRQ